MGYSYKYDLIGIITKQGDKYSVNELCDMFDVPPEIIIKQAREDIGELENKIDEKMSNFGNHVYESDFERFFF